MDARVAEFEELMVALQNVEDPAADAASDPALDQAAVAASFHATLQATTLGEAERDSITMSREEWRAAWTSFRAKRAELTVPQGQAEKAASRKLASPTILELKKAVQTAVRTNVQLTALDGRANNRMPHGTPPGLLH